MLAAGYLAVSLFVVLRFTAPNRQPPERTPADVGLEYREVSFESTDGVPLAAWWVSPTEEGSSRAAAVLVHGWEGDRSDLHIVETAQVYAHAGYGVLMLDLRGNGGSGDERRTLGYKETQDVQGALAWLEEAGYADLPLILRKQIPEASGLPRLFNTGVLLAAKYFLGFDPWAVWPSEDAAQLREEGVPLLVIHSTDDEVVPFEHAELFERAYPEAAFWKVEGLGHVEAYTHREYREKLLNFLGSGYLK